MNMLHTEISRWWDEIQMMLQRGSDTQWESLVINKRKPHTYRAWSWLSRYDLLTDIQHSHRVCLHRFEPCEAEEAFSHPHGWPAEFLVLSGRYLETVWRGHNESCTDARPVSETLHVAGTWHKIDNEHTWHKIQPLTTTFTLMINGPAYSNPLGAVRTTAGKDLDKMSREELGVHLSWCNLLMSMHSDNWSHSGTRKGGCDSP